MFLVCVFFLFWWSNIMIAEKRVFLLAWRICARKVRDIELTWDKTLVFLCCFCFFLHFKLFISILLYFFFVFSSSICCVFVLVSLLLFFFVPACMSLSFPGVPQHANAPWPGFASLQMSLFVAFPMASLRSRMELQSNQTQKPVSFRIAFWMVFASSFIFSFFFN